MHFLRSAFWPKAETFDFISISQKRVFSVLCLTIGILGVLSGSISARVNFAIEPLIAVCGILVPILIGLTPILVLKFERLRLFAIGIIALLYIHLLNTALSGGGAHIEAAFYLPAIPILTTILIGLRSGIAATLLMVLTYSALQPEYLSFWTTLPLIIMTVGLMITVGVHQGEINQVTMIINDAREKADAGNKAKSVFLANMSHEIRTPMNGVLGLCQALSHTPLNNEQRSLLKIIDQSGEALTALLNDILDLSKIETDNLLIADAPFKPIALIESVKSLYAHNANEKDLKLYCAYDNDIDVEAMGDAIRIRQVLCNLVSNAIKFTDRGAVTISLKRRAARNGSGDDLVFMIQDTGAGMNDSNTQEMFEPFVQGDASTTRSVGGTGLGLTISRQLVDLMGGWIEVESALGKGSKFSFAIPFTPAESSGLPVADKSVGKAPCTGSTKPMKILAAEDNQINQLALQQLLKPMKPVLKIVSDGRQAIDAWRSEEFDIILMDVQMPEMDGVEATSKIRKLEQSLDRCRTPILALTANAMSHQVQEYMDAGLDGHVAKPIDENDLMHAIRKLAG